DAGGVGVRAGVVGLEDAEVQVADLALGPVGFEEVPAGNHAVIDAQRPVVVAPAEHLRIELAGRGRIVGGEVDEDQGVRIAHCKSSRFGQAAYSARLGVNTSRLSTG